MACTSGSVKTVADKTVAAKAQIDKLHQMLEQQEAANKRKFHSEISSHLASAKIKDATELDYNSYIKTEYTSEFSLKKITDVVIGALKAAMAAKNPTVPNAAMSPEAIEAYTYVVNTVAEAAKSSSKSSASLSFSMNRLSPGIYAFLYAVSVSIKDSDTFGDEAVTSTAIYYRMMQSIDDVKNQERFGSAIINANNLLKMKMLQAGLTDQLALGKISIEVWVEKDAAYSEAIRKIQQRLNEDKFDMARPFALSLRDGFGEDVSHSFAKGSVASQEVVRAAIQKLSAKGEAYKIVIETSEARLASNYY